MATSSLLQPWEGILYKTLSDEDSLSDQLFWRVPVQKQHTGKAKMIGNDSGLVLLRGFADLTQQVKTDRAARAALELKVNKLEQELAKETATVRQELEMEWSHRSELEKLRQDFQHHKESISPVISRHDDALSFLYNTSKCHGKWLSELVDDKRRAGPVGSMYRANRVTTMFEWAGLPYVSGAWEFRNELVHGGDVLTDAELLPYLLLHNSGDDYDIRLLDSFKNAYGMSLQSFKNIAQNASEDLINVLDMACTIRVVMNWQRPQRRAAKSRIVKLANDMVEGNGGSATYSEMLWIYGGRGYAS